MNVWMLHLIKRCFSFSYIVTTLAFLTNSQIWQVLFHVYEWCIVCTAVVALYTLLFDKPLLLPPIRPFHYFVAFFLSFISSKIIKFKINIFKKGFLFPIINWEEENCNKSSSSIWWQCLLWNSFTRLLSQFVFRVN